jgi:hypothetical protein
MARKRVLKQDPLVDKLRPDPSQPPSIERRGFLGRSDKEGHWRLYLTRGLTNYVEIAETDVVHHESLATADDPDAGSRVWIKDTAILTLGPPRQVQAENLDGAISCGSLGEWRVMEPGVDLATLLMVPILPWAIAARFWCAAFTMLERRLIGSQSPMRVTSDSYLCGRADKVILLSPHDYKVG